MVYQSHPGNGHEASATLYRTLYWMHAAQEAGVGPSMALIRAQLRATGTATVDHGMVFRVARVAGPL